jgi:hypothetical protein
MAEHRGRVIQIGGREDQRDPLRRDLRQPRRKLRTGLFRQARRIEIERGLQPSVARDERALGMLGVRLGVLWSLGRGEERGERRLELGLRVGPAPLGVEEVRAVDQAGMTSPQQIRAVVAEIEPRAILREALAAGSLDQLLQIAGTSRRGRRGEADQNGDDEAKMPS